VEVPDRIGHNVMENRRQIRIGRSTTGSSGIRPEIRGEPAGYLPDAPTYKGRQDVTRIIIIFISCNWVVTRSPGNIMLVHSGFPNAKELLHKLSAILTYTLKNVRQPCPSSKKFEEYRFEWRQTFGLPGAPIYLEPGAGPEWYTQRVFF
jgi:hypothetical protein